MYLTNYFFVTILNRRFTPYSFKIEQVIVFDNGFDATLPTSYHGKHVADESIIMFHYLPVMWLQARYTSAKYGHSGVQNIKFTSGPLVPRSVCCDD
jgi:hypothetical protein